MPRWAVVKALWPMIRVELKGNSYATLNSLTALSVNSWLGEELALWWSLCHLSCDIVGGLGNTLWSVGQRHMGYWWYGEGKNKGRGKVAWKMVDLPACSLQGLGIVLGGLLVSPCAAIIVVAYAINKRIQALVAAHGSPSSVSTKMEGKVVWVTVCLIGYWLVMTRAASPSLLLPTAVYTAASLLSSSYLYWGKFALSLAEECEEAMKEALKEA